MYGRPHEESAAYEYFFVYNFKVRSITISLFRAKLGDHTFALILVKLEGCNLLRLL